MIEVMTLFVVFMLIALMIFWMYLTLKIVKINKKASKKYYRKEVYYY